MSEDELLSALKASQLLKKKTMKEIREKLRELRYKFSKSDINEIRKNLCEIENEKSPFTPKKIEKCLLGLEKKPF